MQLSLLLGKNIYAEGQHVGAIDGICWQKGQPCLIKSGDETLTAEKVRLKGNVIVQNLQTIPALPALDLGKSVYDTEGRLLGKISDAEITATLKVKSLTLDNGTIVPLSKIIANNDIVTVRINKPKQPKAKIDAKQRQTPTTAIAPKRRSGDFSFLVGKQVDKNIFNFLGELMIREGETVTREVYLKAKSFGKLTELCLHTR